MKNTLLARVENSVYPGLYTPVPEMQFTHDKVSSEPCTLRKVGQDEIREEGHLLVIDIALPGYERQDIFITGYGNLLSIVVLNNSGASGQDNDHVQPNHNLNTYHKNFVLPGNADGEWASASYRNGYLSVFIPTGSTTGCRTKEYRIMVY